MSSTHEHALPATERYGKYTLMQRLGVGGMAEAFKAVVEGARGFRRTMVVKRILPHLAGNEQLVELFTHEARLCALLSHPNIVQVEDFGEADGSHFIAMEYLDGQSLLWLLQRLGRAGEHLPFTVAAWIARQVASGLDYAHQLTGSAGEPLGIVHRDVKPGNVMLLHNGQVKLLDFGVAKAANMSGQPPTCAGILKGTVGYHAPEQLLGEPLDGRSDIFSLGVVLWEMLATQRLYWAATAAVTYRRILEEPVSPPSAVRPDVPLALEQIAMRALQKSPGDRYPSAAEMAADLDAWLHHQAFDAQEMPRMLRTLEGERYRRPLAVAGEPTLAALPSAPEGAPGEPAAGEARGVSSAGVPGLSAADSYGSTLHLRGARRRLLLIAGTLAGVGLGLVFLLRPGGDVLPPAVTAAAGPGPSSLPPPAAPAVPPAAPAPKFAAPSAPTPAAASRPRRKKPRRAAVSAAAVRRRPAPAAVESNSSGQSRILNAEPEDPFR